MITEQYLKLEFQNQGGEQTLFALLEDLHFLKGVQVDMHGYLRLEGLVSFS